MKKNMAIALAIGVAGITLQAQAAILNTNVTFSSTTTWAQSPGFEYWFGGGVASTWTLNNYARVILEGGGNNNRMFVGVNKTPDDSGATLDLTTSTGTPGLFSAMGNTYAGFRIGHSWNEHTSPGALNINGGVQVDTGRIFGEGTAGSILNINQGRINMLDANQRGDGLITHVGQQGRLFTIGTVSSVADYQNTHAAGSTLTADVGRKVRFITDGVEHSPFHTASAAAGVDGTLITTIPDAYKEVNLSNQSFGNGLTDWTVVEANGQVYEDENVPGLRGNRVALLKARGAANYFQQVLSGSEDGAMDAGTFTDFEIQFDLGYRRDSTTFGDGEFEVSLWNITDGAELDSFDVMLTDPGAATDGNNFMTAMIVNLSVDTTGLSGKELALRFTNTKDLGTGEWASTLTLDNVSVSAIPEPATIGLVLAMGGAMLFVRRKIMM